MKDNCTDCLSCPKLVRTESKKQDILVYLKTCHRGRRNAVHSIELERLFHLDGRELRRKISSLRRAGHPICSGDMGYYYAETQNEINSSVSRLNDMLTGISNTRDRLLCSQVQKERQTVEITITINGGEL